MRKRFVLMLCLQSALLLFLFSSARAQVFNGSLELNTQAQVDAFNYTSVTGNLTIRPLGSAIQNLDGLSELTSVDGFLAIRNNTVLTNVDGLSNLISIGSNPPAPPVAGFLALENNPALTNVNGFSSLTSIGGALFLMNNPALTNLDGFSNVTDIDGGLNFQDNNALTNLDGLLNISSLGGTGFLILRNNTALTSIDGLTNISSVNSLEISGTQALTNINGLSNIISVGDLEISRNQALTDINGLSGITIVFGGLFISNNLILSNLDGLSNLKRVTSHIGINRNNNLTNVDGLAKLEQADGIFNILFNPVLENLDGLLKLNKVGGHLTITGNAALANIDGLSNLTTIGGNLGMGENILLSNLDGLSNLDHVGLNLGIDNNPALIDFCGLSKLFDIGTIGASISIKNNGANTVELVPPLEVIVNADQGYCSAILQNATIGTATPVGCLKPFITVHSDFPLGNVFPVGTTQITWIVTDGAGNAATSIQTITVIDNQPPTIICPGNLTIKCASDVPDIDINSVTAIDNCLAVISHVSDVISDQTCANRFTLTRTYKVTDAGNNTAACSQVITVYDDIPPQITGFTISKQSLWPPNHTMRDITLNYTASDNCVSDPIITVTVSSNEPVNGTGDGDTDPDWEIIDNHHIKLRAERAANGDGRIYTITVTVDDGCNPLVSQSKQVMVTHNITGPQSGKPFKVGSIVNFSGVFQDKPGTTHTAKWLLDGSAAANGTVIEPSGNVNGKVSGSYKFNSPGVYKLQMNVTDQTGITSYANTNNDLDAIVVIYDPNGGNTYGGGYFNSPAGALRADPSATGKASYGFAMNYFKNSTNPKGETQFEFKVGEFEFNALNFDYLVISNSMAQFKGTGKIIGGQSGIGFTMTVTDGELDGSGVDKIRMKIYNKNNGSIIYDNQPGASDAALPTQAVGNNSMVVISGTNSSLTSANTNQKAEMETNTREVSGDLDVIAFPNPSTNNFTINVSAKVNEKITMQVVDMYGRIIEKRNVTVNSLIKFGDRYTAGTYFVRVIQGKQHKEIKLIKLSD